MNAETWKTLENVGKRQVWKTLFTKMKILKSNSIYSVNTCLSGTQLFEKIGLRSHPLSYVVAAFFLEKNLLTSQPSESLIYPEQCKNKNISIFRAHLEAF